MDERSTYWRSVYGISGMHGLIAQGADIDTILVIRNDERRERGITKEDDDAAYKAYKSAEKVGNGYIINLPHKHWRSITDFMLCSLEEFIVIDPDDNVVVRPFEGLQKEYEKVFGRSTLVDEHYLMFSKASKVKAVSIFRNYELNFYHKQCRRRRLPTQCFIHLLLHQS
jgi:hypothetical protein